MSNEAENRDIVNHDFCKEFLRKIPLVLYKALKVLIGYLTWANIDDIRLLISRTIAV